jgi:hypothetical protein
MNKPPIVQHLGVLIAEARDAIEKNDKDKALEVLKRMELGLKAFQAAAAKYAGSALIGEGMRAAARYLFSPKKGEG